MMISVGECNISIIEVFYLNEKENSLYFLPLDMLSHIQHSHSQCI